jgi:hypothetical protein
MAGGARASSSRAAPGRTLNQSNPEPPAQVAQRARTAPDMLGAHPASGGSPPKDAASCGNRSRRSLRAFCFTVLASVCVFIKLRQSVRFPTHVARGQELLGPTATQDFAHYLRARSLSSKLQVAVVGNGPLQQADREAIESSDVVIRFNDCAYLREGEKTTLRVVRHPFPLLHDFVEAPIWHIAPRKGLCESHRPDRPVEICPHHSVVIFTPAYQSQYGSTNELDSSARIFSECDANNSNIQGLRYGGPSSGGLVLSHLQSSQDVASIDVFGMNWNGNPALHVDFANRSLVGECCTKCRIHQTATSFYGEKSKTFYNPHGDSFYRIMQGISGPAGPSEPLGPQRPL